MPLITRKTIVHQHFVLGMSPEEIAPLIPSPRSDTGGLSIKAVKSVIDFFDLYHHVEDIPRAPRVRTMLERHAEIMIEIAENTPYLYLDELADALQLRCHFPYRPGLCYAELRRRGLSLQVMSRKALQRNEFNRFLYWSAILEEMQFPAQLVFADETGQDNRANRRRRGWGPVGARVKIPEFLNRGKHISILALFGYSGFIDFDYVEGGYSAEDFLLAVEFMIIPHLNPYPAQNSILILDNCRIHHTHIDQLCAMIYAVGAKLIFLAPYAASQDSPIEQGFNVLKAAWRRSAHALSDVDIPLGQRIRHCISTCYTNPEVGAAATYEKCGYY